MTETKYRDSSLPLPLLLSQKSDQIAAWLTTHLLTPEQIQWLAAQNLAPFLAHHLKSLDLLQHLPAQSADALRRNLFMRAAQAALQQVELAKVLDGLAAANLSDLALLMKGSALAYTVYPLPACRPRGDIDIWMPPAHFAQTVDVLAELGYAPRNKEYRPPAFVALVGGEQQMVHPQPGTGLIEVQQPAIRGEWIRLTAAIDHAGVFERRVWVDIAGRQARVMADEDLLLHLCVHMAINHQFSMPWLRGLLDIHLLAQRPLDWAVIVARAKTWRIFTLTWTVLDLAVRLMGAPVPKSVLAQLAPSGARQRLIHSLGLGERLVRLDKGGYSYRRFVIQTLMVDRPRDVVRLYGRALFPETVWLQARYGISAPVDIWRKRLTHPLHVFTTAQV